MKRGTFNRRNCNFSFFIGQRFELRLSTVYQMPVLGKADPPPKQPLFYKSLQELDSWSPDRHYHGIVKYKSRIPAEKSNKGRLLVRSTIICDSRFGILNL